MKQLPNLSLITALLCACHEAPTPDERKLVADQAERQESAEVEVEESDAAEFLLGRIATFDAGAAASADNAAYLAIEVVGADRVEFAKQQLYAEAIFLSRGQVPSQKSCVSLMFDFAYPNSVAMARPYFEKAVELVAEADPEGRCGCLQGTLRAFLNGLTSEERRRVAKQLAQGAPHSLTNSKSCAASE